MIEENEFLKKLDLSEFLKDFTDNFSRAKELNLQGDQQLHLKRINELALIDYNPPPCTKNLNKELIHLSKQGILHLDELVEFIKIFHYFIYLKKLKFQNELKDWLDKIEFPQSILELCDFFDSKFTFKEDSDERLINLNQSLKFKKEQSSNELQKLLHSKSLMPYLIDTQVHFINDKETLLLRAGFSKFLKAKIIARSNGGGFYVFASSLESLQKDCEEIYNLKEEIYYEYGKKFSLILHKQLLFLKFINNAFDLFDHYSARVLFAKKKDLEFIICSGGNTITLKDFAHPALKNPKSINLNFNKQALIITGVNAGGKSMLLKSILSAVFLAKNLLPMKIKANQSKIANFKDLNIILEDPQNVKNDISTFAGRMLLFSEFLTYKNLLLGIDEIELGTDFEEAACLYKVLIEKLISNGVKLIITTHHKKLAMLLAKNEEVELLAALYDENLSRAKYEFLKGTIGKSYAFETALRYGISKNLIQEAKKLYGEDKENLEELIGQNIKLELKLQSEQKELEKKKQKADEILNTLKEQKENNELEFKKMLSKLEFEFHKAIKEAKKTLDFTELKDKQRAINKANALRKNINFQIHKDKEELKVGDFVSYEKIKGKIVNISKDQALVQSENLQLKVALNLLKKSKESPKQSNISVKIAKPKNAKLSLDLHGLRSDEAIEKLDLFLSDALLAGFDEVLVYHGIGTGKLAFVVKEFLKNHKSVKSYNDAPFNQGGFGAKIVKL